MVNYKYDNALHNAAAICDVEGLRRCLTPEALAACPINTRDRDDHTALHALCRYEGPRRDDDLYDLRMLPKELVRHVVSFWLHAGYY